MNNVSISTLEKSIISLSKKLEKKGFICEIDKVALGNYQGSYVNLIIRNEDNDYYLNVDFLANGYPSMDKERFSSEYGLKQMKKDFSSYFEKDYANHLVYIG